jgi:hypothetical protein
VIGAAVMVGKIATGEVKDVTSPTPGRAKGGQICPACGLAYPVVSAVQKHFEKRLRFVFRHFPLTKVHQHAESAMARLLDMNRLPLETLVPIGTIGLCDVAFGVKIGKKREVDVAVLAECLVAPCTVD